MAKKIITIEVFPDDKEVSIKIDSELYNRLVQVLVESALQNTTTDLAEYFQNILDNEVKSRYEEHLATMLELIGLIENAARAQNLTIKKDVEVDDEDGSVNVAEEKPAES
jgi:hypothetical protein